MNTKIIAIILMPLLLTACGKSLGASLLALGGERDPDRVGSLNLTIHEMFPNDRQIRSLALAASDGDVKKIDQLVTNGVDVNSVGERGLPVTFWLLSHPNNEGFKRLLEHGVNPNILLKTSFAGREYYISLIHEAAERSVVIGVDYLKMILTIGKGDPNLELPDNGARPIGEVVNRGEEEAFAILYNAGAEIDYSDNYDSLLYRAFRAENYELSFFLLQQGVDFKWKNGRGQDVRSIINITSGFRPWIVNGNSWFWRCVDFLEKEGMPIEIPSDVKRPEILDTTPPRILKLIKKR